eukprot:gene4680-4581_t
MDPNALYEIHIDNDGDAQEEITFQFNFRNNLRDLSQMIGTESVSIPLIQQGPVNTVGSSNLNLNETYTLTVVRDGRRNNNRTLAAKTSGGSTTLEKPVDYIGEKTLGNAAAYQAYADAHIHNVTIPGCASGTNQARVFVGQRQEGFAVNLGTIFDLVNAPFEHSGGGKANQYFLRGFSLDHGTDLSINFLGAPLNLPGHAHGQGYTDSNMIIPELLSRVEYRKGPYFAQDGDFSSAGALNIDYINELKRGLASISVGEFGYRRGLLANSKSFNEGQTTVLYALELTENDGPWKVEENQYKYNVLLKLNHRIDASKRFELQYSGYESEWTSTDHIPVDAVRAYVADYKLNLFSDFTYGLRDNTAFGRPGVLSDQFNQFDSRVTYGGAVTHTLFENLSFMRSQLALGLDYRVDENLSASATLFQLESDSELVFVGDAGTTEPKGATKRNGVELIASYFNKTGFEIDGFVTLVDARFVGVPDNGIPNAIEESAALSMAQTWGDLKVGYKLKYTEALNQIQ